MNPPLPPVYRTLFFGSQALPPHTEPIFVVFRHSFSGRKPELGTAELALPDLVPLGLRRVRRGLNLLQDLRDSAIVLTLEDLLIFGETP